MTQKEIIEENIARRRKIEAPYKPVSGEGSDALPRTMVEIEGLPIEKMYLPTTLLADAEVAQLAEQGVEKYLSGRGVKEITQRDIVSLWIAFCRKRIKHDFEYWARSCATISDKCEGRDIPFTLNRPQRHYLKTLEALRLADKPIDIILLKARQWGGSTLTQLYMLWIQLVHKNNWNSVICGDIEKQSSIVAGMLAKVIRRYPRWASGGCAVTTAPYQGAQKTRVITPGNCRYSLGSAQKPDSLRSEDISMAHLTEVGLWRATTTKKPEDLVQSIFGSIVSRPYTVKVIESTAKGVGNYFHRTWIDACEGRNNFTPVFIPWYTIDLYSKEMSESDYPGFCTSMNEYERQLFDMGATLEAIAWYRDKRREMPEEWRLSSEFPSTPTEAFQSTGHRVFPLAYVRQLREGCIPAPFTGDIICCGQEECLINGRRKVVERTRFAASEGTNENSLSIWLMPEEKPTLRDRYIVAVDVGGISNKADFSCIVVIDRGAMPAGGVPEVVAVWHGHIEHDRLAWKAVEIARAYGNALLVIEANTLETEGTEGDNFEYILNEISGKYSNLYSRTSQQEIKQGRPRRWGFHTNSSTKPMVINFLLKAMRDGLYIERCIETTYELDLYEIKENGKEMGAVEGNHDDRVMATAIAVWISYNHPLPSRIAHETHSNKRTRIVSEASI